MSQDLLQILTGETAAKPVKATKPAKYDPFDAAVRTVIAEESDPAAQEWVAGVIANRLKSGKYGKDLYEVVTAEGQFEPWARGTAQKVDPNSPDYKATAERVKDILEGKRDPSGGATHFYAPEAQAKLGREKPAWDDGTGSKIGNTLFFREPGQAKGTELASILGASVDSAALDEEFARQFGDPARFTSETIEEGAIPFREVEGRKTPGVLSKPQETFFATLNKGGGYKPDEAPGSSFNPLFMQEGVTEKDIPPGAYYVTRAGDIKRAAGGEEESSFVRGLGQGAADVMLSVAQAFPGAEDSTIRNRLITDQSVYDAALKGDLKSGLGRFTGQVAASAPLIAGAEAVALPAFGGSAIGRLFLGKAGTQMAPGVGRALTRGGSLAAKGAAEGAAAAGLVSSASDAPIEEQIATGALAGGILGPALPAVAGAGQKAGEGVRRAFEGMTYGGREKAIERLLGELGGELSPDIRTLVPGSQPTLGEASGNAAIAALERNARTNPRLAPLFAERLEENAAARREFFDTIAKDPEAVAEAVAARDAATDALRAEAFKGAKTADPSQVLIKIDEILKGPSGKRDVVVKALTNLRGKLAQEVDIGGGQKVLQPETDVEQLYGVRKAIDDTLSPMGPSEAKGAQLATRELMEVKNALDKAIEEAAPGFKEYLKTYSEMSKPIDEMKYLQGLNLTDSKGNITLAKVQNAIDRIEKQRGAGGVNKAKALSDDTLGALKALRDDLKRASDIDKGRARGSDTAANLVMGKFVEERGVPLASTVLNAKFPGAGIVLGAAQRAQAERNQRMLDQLASRLLQPERSIPSVKVTPRKKAIPVGEVMLPVLGSISASALTAPK